MSYCHSHFGFVSTTDRFSLTGAKHNNTDRGRVWGRKGKGTSCLCVPGQSRCWYCDSFTSWLFVKFGFHQLHPWSQYLSSFHPFVSFGKRHLRNNVNSACEVVSLYLHKPRQTVAACLRLLSFGSPVTMAARMIGEDSKKQWGEVTSLRRRTITLDPAPIHLTYIFL